MAKQNLKKVGRYRLDRCFPSPRQILCLTIIFLAFFSFPLGYAQEQAYVETIQENTNEEWILVDSEGIAWKILTIEKGGIEEWKQGDPVVYWHLEPDPSDVYRIINPEIKGCIRARFLRKKRVANPVRR